MSDTVIVQPDDRAPKRSRAGLAIVLLLVVAGLGAWAWFATRPEPARVVRRDIEGRIPLTGEIIAPPSARADVGAPFRAPVEKVFVSVSKKVGKGDWLVQLAVPNAQAYIDQARQNLQAAETAYANGKRALDGPVSAARANLVNAQAAEAASRPSPSTVVQPDGSSTTVIPSTGGQALPARIAAEQTLAQAEANRAAQLGVLKTQLDMAREAYESARSGENIGVIKSPISGTVLALNAVPGQEVGKDAKVPVATVVDLSALQVKAPLDTQQASYVKPGMPVSITLAEAPGRTLDGKVSKIASEVDEKLGGLVKQSRYVALVEFNNKDSAAKPGMKPVVALKTGEAKGALAVPSEAVDAKNGVPTVKVLRNNAWQVVSVETGVSDGRFTELKSGVKEGETVQVTPNLVNAANLPGK